MFPFSLLSAGVGLATKTTKIGFNPAEYTYERWCAHDPIHKNERLTTLYRNFSQLKIGHNR
ncbi:MAG: hypothetical protein HWD61_15075 [Parachlamydiaceae bacterium]|nr:MAG: hypothetical protein HWD61_15075 [Parachlamydiaceae bacterium]